MYRIVPDIASLEQHHSLQFSDPERYRPRPVGEIPVDSPGCLECGQGRSDGFGADVLRCHTRAGWRRHGLLGCSSTTLSISVPGTADPGGGRRQDPRRLSRKPPEPSRLSHIIPESLRAASRGVAARVHSWSMRHCSASRRRRRAAGARSITPRTRAARSASKAFGFSRASAAHSVKLS